MLAGKVCPTRAYNLKSTIRLNKRLNEFNKIKYGKQNS
jgi:hypothetical protein